MNIHDIHVDKKCLWLKGFQKSVIFNTKFISPPHTPSLGILMSSVKTFENKHKFLNSSLNKEQRTISNF